MPDERQLSEVAQHLIDRLVERMEKLADIVEFVVPVLKTLAKESDRGCILIVASMFDELLEECLKAKFTEDSGETEDDQNWLLSEGANPPLQNFGVKTRLAYVLGIIDKPTRKSLDAIRRLRRDCAHGWTQVTLTNDNIRPILDTLSDSEREQLHEGMEKWVSVPDPLQLSEIKMLLTAAATLIALRFTRLVRPTIEGEKPRGLQASPA